MQTGSLGDRHSQGLGRDSGTQRLQPWGWVGRLIRGSAPRRKAGVPTAFTRSSGSRAQAGTAVERLGLVLHAAAARGWGQSGEGEVVSDRKGGSGSLPIASGFWSPVTREDKPRGLSPASHHWRALLALLPMVPMGEGGRAPLRLLSAPQVLWGGTQLGWGTPRPT
jgi:hypothetical protein